MAPSNAWIIGSKPASSGLSLTLNGRRPTLFSSGTRGIRWIERHEFAHHAIGPAEAVLQWIFAAAAKPPGGNDIVFLHQLPVLAVHAIYIEHPATGDGLRERQNGVPAQTRDADPLQWRPTVGCIPLLSGEQRCCDDAAGFEQIARNHRGHGDGLWLGGKRDEQRIEGRRGDSRHLRLFHPTIVAIDAGSRIPQIAIHRIAPPPGPMTE